MRNIALVLIVSIVAIVVFIRNYDGNDGKKAASEQIEDQTTPLKDVLPSRASNAPSGSNPIVILNPAVASAKAAPEPQPKPEPVAAFAPQGSPESPSKPVAAANGQAEKAVVPPASVQPEALPAVTDDGTDTSSPEAKEQIDEALRLRDAGKTIAARELLENTLSLQLSPTLRSGVKLQLAKLTEAWLWSRDVLAGDKLTESYTVQRGDLMQNIAQKYKVPYEILMQINGISRPELLRAGQNIKVISGPFNAVVYKNSFVMDLYLQNKYVKTYRVGLGRKEYETPNGRWRVEAGGKLIKPTWTDPDTGRTYVGDDPDYPLGSRWIALEGLEGEAKGRAGFAIHGTKEPESIGTRSSRGCIRLFNGDAVEVYNLLYGGISEVLVKD
jgi:lipoprotein-anchoring transpeptidase ErfK/SrfK